MPNSILCVEDDLEIAALLHYNLQSDFRCVDHVTDGKSAHIAIRTKQYDLLLLDLDLPDIHGTKLCQVIRQDDFSMPIIVLTGSTSEKACIDSLDSGADDYIQKPFRTDELKARINAVLRRGEILLSPASSIFAGDIEIRLKERLVTRNSEVIELTSKEFDLLEYLMRHEGQVFSRAQLLDAVWGFAYSGYDHTVNSHINRLRSKLELNSDKPKYVITVWGVGYKFGSSTANGL